MPQVIILCCYCNHKENRYIYQGQSHFTCEKCKDSNLKITPYEEEDTDKFGYNYKDKKSKNNANNYG